jgi:ABC-type uncharacterized transport system permease subunit
MEAMLKLMGGVNECFTALALNYEFTPASKGLIGILTGETRKRITSEVAKCNRVTAYVTFHQMGPIAEICFCEQKNIVRKLTISFVLATQEFLVIAK